MIENGHRAIGLIPVLLCVFSGAGAAAGESDAARPAAQPVLVELFTSEGCSSCPPADALLAELDRGTLNGVAVVALSEHVDYWNHLGWTDPYSSAAFSARQRAYASRFGLGSIYTPQMVVDGSFEFVGNDGGRARDAIRKASAREKMALRIESVARAQDRLEIRVAGGGAGTPARRAALFIALADDRDVSQVRRGENAGRELSHVAVVRSLTNAGVIGAGGAGREFTKEVRVPIQKGWKLESMRVVAFLEAEDGGPVLGAAMRRAQE